MKMKSKLLLTIPCAAVTAIAPVCACGETPTSAEKMADAIFKPTDITSPVKLDKSFSDSLKAMTQEERNHELVYDLYKRFNQPYDGTAKTIKELYMDNTVGINTNINPNFYSLKFNDEGKLIANFLGSITFVFLKDYDDNHKVNDYFMFTYDIKNMTVVIDEDKCFLSYVDDGYIIGLEKIRSNGGEHMKDIKDITQPITGLPNNSKNWIK